MPLEPGTHIVGRFEIVGPIGAGSMGEVYQAHDRTLGRDVALKLLSPALATSEQHLRRFEREARSASALNHPHICTIYDVGQAPEADGRPYLVMELLRGATLHELMAAGPMAVPRVVALGIQIAEALEVAHTAGIIHRDLKPANIFVTARGDAKLLDFGLAAMIEPDDPAERVPVSDAQVDPALTSLGTAVGTVLYMSPEQALGDPLDGRTDVFSFGLVLYEMVTGRRAFEGRSPSAIVDAILHTTPAGIDVADASNVPKTIRLLLARMLEKDRDRRLSSAAEVALELRAMQSAPTSGGDHAATQPVSSSGVGSGGVVSKSDVDRRRPGFTPSTSTSSWSIATLASRNVRLVVAITFVTLLVAAALYGAYSWYRPSTPSLVLREPLLLTEFSNTTGEAVFDGALKDALEIQLQQSPFLNVLSASQVRSTLQLMARSPNEPLTSPLARDICERLGVYAILSGSIAPLSSAYVITLEAQACRSGATLASEQTQAASKTDVLATVSAAAANIREQLGESIGSIQRFNVPAPNATTPSLEALKAYSMGLETRIKTGDVQAIPLFEHALELDPNFALAAARLGSIYMNVHELDQAQNYMRRAFARSESLSEPERLFVRANYHFIVTGRLDDVVATYRMWIAAYPTDWVPHNNLSAAYQRLNQFDLALDEAREAVRLGPASVVPYQQLARVLLPLDRLPEAAAVLGDAASRRLESSVIHALAFQLAFVDRDAGRMQQHLGAAVSRPDGYLVVAEAARAAFASGDLETGRTLYAQAVSATRQARVHDMAGSLIAEEALSDALVGDSAGALRELQQAVATSAGVETTWTASLGAAFSGAAPQAAELADAFQRAAPPAPDVVSASAPMLRAAVALASNDGRRALAILTSVTPYARAAGPLLPYLRGLAHTALQEHTRAVEQFNSVVEQRGNQPTSLLHTLGLLQLARSARAAGDMARARAAYADFARAWSGAPRHPLFEAAASEAASLPPPSASVPPTR